MALFHAGFILCIILTRAVLLQILLITDTDLVKGLPTILKLTEIYARMKVVHVFDSCLSSVVSVLGYCRSLEFFQSNG